ncbi:MAG TPA: penicillin-binding protein 2 [Usitatibacteraceae bacterium]
MNFSSKRIASPELRLKLEGWRSRVVLIGCLGVFAILLGRSFYLQGLNNDFLQAKGEARFVRVVDMPASRGAVMDRNGKALAISTPVESIWAAPADMEALDNAQLNKLASVLAMDRKQLADKLGEKEKNFVWVKRQLSPDQAARVMALKIPRLFQQREFRRYYPAGDVTAHVIGFTSLEDQGQEGIELAQQSLLAGFPGQRRVIKDRKGRIVEDVESLKVPREGRPLSLSIDERLQYIAHRELKAAVEANKAKGGALVMLDAHTGEVLALVNQPDFNPNNRANFQPRQMRNRSVTDTFEPGSTFKPFAVAAGLEAGIIKPDTVIQTGNGLTMAGYTITDTHPAPQLSVAEIIQHSSNIGTAKIALQLPAEQLWNFYNELGFGLVPKTGFPGEASGRLRPARAWRPVEQATMSYGYGVSVSALQLARAYTIFTNDGVLLPATFMKRDGEVIGKQIISAKTARALSQMLETVTQAGGTAVKGHVPGYRVAGKTGSAWKIVNGQYAENLYLSSFVGYGPVSNPRYIVAVTIDEPSAGKVYGGDVSAPVFSNVMSQALRLAGVPPDAQIKEAAAPAVLAAAKDRG